MANLQPVRALNLDNHAQKLFITYFKGLGEKPQTTVRIFDRNDYYSVHGDDAEFAARHIFKSTAFVKIMEPSKNNELPYITLSKANFESFVRDLLLVKNYRVEVYTCKKGKNEWTLEFRGSPGNLVQFEDILFGNNDMVTSSTIIGLHYKKDSQMHIGLSCIDMNEQTFQITEFTDNDFFAELEALIVLLGPKEAILPTMASTDTEFARLKDMLHRNNVMVTHRKKSDFSIDKSNIIQDLNKLLRFSKGQQPNASALPEINNTLALASLGAAIQYLELINDSTNFGYYKLSLLNLKRYVHLDSAAVTALNLFPKPGTPLNSNFYKWQSVLGVLDRCRTAQGHRLMMQWIKQPLRDQATIRERHDIVECLVDSVSTRDDLYDNYMKRMPDVLMLIKKLMRKRATLQDIFRIYQVVARLPKLLNIFTELQNSTVQSAICDPIQSNLDDLVLFKQMVEQIVDFKSVERGEFLIKPTFDDQLYDLKGTMDDIEEKMQRQHTKAINDLDMENIKLEIVSKIGYHFRTTTRDTSSIKKNSKYKIIDAINSGVRFTSDRLTELNEEFLQARGQYEELQQSIVDEVVKTVLGYTPPLTFLNHLLAQIDCLVSFAVAAASAPIPFIRPTIHAENTGILKLKGLRHPCLELQDDVTYIPNDVEFKKDETNMYIITGPNMGGKSTYIRSVGTAVLMAHIGSFVPCSEAEISIVDSILGRVGANDNLVKGLSTFMVEMIETAGIIRTATQNSIVIIDELGRGTSTYEGCGIAWSIAEYLAKETKCFTLFATHFHEITELANDCHTVKNCHMVAIADNDNFTLLYQVRPGVMDKSFGIQVAKLANFPHNVVDLAQRVYDESEDHYTQLKSKDDDEVSRLFMESLEKLTATSVEDLDEAEIEKIAREIREKVKSTEGDYFRSAFPNVFQ